MINVYFRGGALAVRYRRVRPPPAMTHARLNTASRLTVPGRSRYLQGWLIAAPLFVDLISVVRPTVPRVTVVLRHRNILPVVARWHPLLIHYVVDVPSGTAVKPVRPDNPTCGAG